MKQIKHHALTQIMKKKQKNKLKKQLKKNGFYISRHHKVAMFNKKNKCPVPKLGNFKTGGYEITNQNLV